MGVLKWKVSVALLNLIAEETACLCLKNLVFENPKMLSPPAFDEMVGFVNVNFIANVETRLCFALFFVMHLFSMFFVTQGLG